MPEKRNSLIPPNIRFLFWSLLVLMVFSFSFRLALFLMNQELAENTSRSDILYSLFNIGLRFDLVVALFIVGMPFLISSVPYLFGKSLKPYLRVANLLLIILGTVFILVATFDLGFFKYYNSRITRTIFDWTNEPGVMFKVMMGDINYLKAFLVFFAASAVYTLLQVRIRKVVSAVPCRFEGLAMRIGLFLLTLILMFFSIRGSFDFSKHPLNIDDAFHSENLFLNQLSHNPLYYMVESYSETGIGHFKEKEDFIAAALSNLDRERSAVSNPFEKEVPGNDSVQPNIILVFLESMSNAMVSRFNPGLQTTPYLDQLADSGIVFDNFYSSGVHTHNAITSTFYGLPAVMDNKPMNELATAFRIFYGMPWILKEKGYQTAFYVTGSKKFDNMDDFLRLNGFDHVIGEADYPDDSIYNSWGVTDQTMFNRVIRDCNDHFESGEKFFSSILTISAHEGYQVPETYRSKIKNKVYPLDIYEFSDLAFGAFIEACKNEPWFDETVFVVVGDHGQNFKATYDLNLNYHRVPLIIYAPKMIDPEIYTGPGMQQDIYPTLFGMFEMNYVNNGLGVDLFRHQRPFGYFSADNKLGVIDDRHLLIYRAKNNISLFELDDAGHTNLFSDNREQADLMLDYGFSMVQSAKFLIDHNMTDVRERRGRETDRFIAHAGGAINGNIYTNSLEALDANYEKGFRLFELDILETSDGHLVAAHDWEGWSKMTGYSGEIPPSLEDFRKLKIYGKYSSLDMAAIKRWFADHSDAILVTDKINKPAKFAGQFAFNARLMMELFTLDAVLEAKSLDLLSVMPNWDVVMDLGEEKLEKLLELGITDVAASRHVIPENQALLTDLKRAGIRVYVYNLNETETDSEMYILCNALNHVYGMYADEFDLSEPFNCNSGSK